MIGNCALCGNYGTLIDSHFMPAALYPELNDPAGPIKHMIVMTRKGTFQSPEQFHMPLLCRACEVRFQQGGENWVLGMRYRSDGTFPLRDLLQRATPVDSNVATSVFDARSLSGVDVDRLLYFAASIFWRAGIANWTTKFADAPKIDLKPEIMAKFADYLLGNGPFPGETSLIVSVASNAQPQRAIICPIKAQETPFVRYEAHIPGMMFELFVDAGPTYDTWSLNNPPERIVLTDLVTKRVLQAAGDIVSESEPKGSLKKHLL
ncbi:MAG: hypothetical protein WBQ76_11820 [Candidatus Korobacteraceae bacterium]